MRNLAGLIVAGSLLAACGDAPEQKLDSAEIAPRDFALLPCGPEEAATPCAITVAGGKRIMFGAPAGVTGTVSPEHLRQLDAVILFSLRAQDIEGLDEVRNASWRAGRDKPLQVVGPEGTRELADAINLAFEQADALRIVEEGIPPGGYDAAVLVGRSIGRGDIAFDTGDVRVSMHDMSSYDVTYNRQSALRIESCAAKPAAQDVENVLNCSADATWQWPLTQVHFVIKGS